MTHSREEQEVSLYIPRWDNGTDYQGYRQCVKPLIFGLWANSNWRAWFGRSGWRLPFISLHQAGERIMFSFLLSRLAQRKRNRADLEMICNQFKPTESSYVEDTFRHRLC
jgi:hypothetical protein